MTLQQRVGRVGLVLGPMLALVLYLALPETFTNAQGKAVAFSQAGRATLAMMAWMATWWMTEAVDIEVTALLPVETVTVRVVPEPVTLVIPAPVTPVVSKVKSVVSTPVTDCEISPSAGAGGNRSDRERDDF